MKNQSFLKKLGDFALGKGFYIVLFLCVATIGISGYYLLQTVLGSTVPGASPVGGDASVTIPDQSYTRPSITIPDPIQDQEEDPPVSGQTPIVQPDDPEPVKGSDPQPEQQGTVSKVFTWPVRGAVLRDFSIEVLSLDPTLGDWRTHGGLDILSLIHISEPTRPY